MTIEEQIGIIVPHIVSVAPRSAALRTGFIEMLGSETDGKISAPFRPGLTAVFGFLIDQMTGRPLIIDRPGETVGIFRIFAFGLTPRKNTFCRIFHRQCINIAAVILKDGIRTEDIRSGKIGIKKVLHHHVAKHIQIGRFAVDHIRRIVAAAVRIVFHQTVVNTFDISVKDTGINDTRGHTVGVFCLGSGSSTRAVSHKGVFTGGIAGGAGNNTAIIQFVRRCIVHKEGVRNHHIGHHLEIKCPRIRAAAHVTVCRHIQQHGIGSAIRFRFLIINRTALGGRVFKECHIVEGRPHRRRDRNSTAQTVGIGACTCRSGQISIRIISIIPNPVGCVAAERRTIHRKSPPMVRIGGIETDGTGIGACTVVNEVTVVHIHGTAGNTLFAPLSSGGIVVNRTALPAGTVPFKMGTVDGQLIPFVIERTPSRIRCPCGIHCPGSVFRCGTHRTGGVVVEHRVDDLGKTVRLSDTVILIIIDQTQIDRAPAAACNIVDKGAVLYQEGTPHGSFVGCGVVDVNGTAHASCCRVPLKYGTVEFKTQHITGGTERTAALGGCIVDEVAVINTQTAISALDIRTAVGMGFVVLENGTVNNAAVSVDRTAAAIGGICPHGHIRHKHGVVDIQTVSGLIRTVDRTAHAVVRHRFRAGVSIRCRIIDPFTANDIVAEKRTGNGDFGGVLCRNRSAVGILAGFARCGVVIKKHTVLQDVAVFIRIIHTVDGDIAETGTDRRTEGVVAVIIHRTMDELRSRTICRGITVDNDIGIISVDRRTVTGLRSLGVFEYTVGHRQTGAGGKKHHTAVFRRVISLRTGQIDVFKIAVADFHIRTFPGSDHTGTAGGTGKIRHSQIVKQHFHAAAHIKQPAGSAAGTAGNSDIGQRCRGSADFGIRGCRVDLHERAFHVLHRSIRIFHVQIKEQIVHHQIVTAEIDPAVEHQVGECGIIHRCRGSGIIQREIVSHKIEQTKFVSCRSSVFVVARFDPVELHIRTDRKIVPPEVNDRTIPRCVPAGQPVNGQRTRDRKILSLEINEPALRTVPAARMDLHIGHRNIAVHDQIAVHAFAAGSRKIDHTAQQTVPDRIDRGIAKHRNGAADIFKIKHAAASILHMETFKVIDAGSVGIPDGNIFCTVHIQEAAVSFVVSGIHVCIAGQRNIPVPFIVDGTAGTAAVGTGVCYISRDPDVVEVSIVDRQV